MKTMTDTNGQVWNVGDRVLRGKTQGIIDSIVSQRIVMVNFPGRQVVCFVTDLSNLTTAEKEATKVGADAINMQ